MELGVGEVEEEVRLSVGLCKDACPSITIRVFAVGLPAEQRHSVVLLSSDYCLG